LKSSTSKKISQKHGMLRVVRILLHREFRLAIENFRLQGLIILQMFLMVFLNAVSWGTNDKWIFDFPFYFIPMILVATSSNLISHERETGMIDLLRLSHITNYEFMVSKLYCSRKKERNRWNESGGS